MAANQYSYPPPPPPPSAQSGPPAGYGQYQQGPYTPAPRGGGRGRGRGNFQGRGDFHASSPYNHHTGGYNGPPQAGGYVPQNSAPYIGPQASGPPNGYPQPQWHEQQQHQPPPHMQVQHQPPPTPVPLSAQNYHPNYAPQVYQQPQPQQGPPQPQYGPQQPQFQHSQPQNSYAQHGPPSQGPHQGGPPQQQWQGPPQGPPNHVQPPYNGGGRGRGRGGGPPGRGGFDAPLMGPPIRMGFGGDRPDNPMPQASNGYPQPYSNQQTPPVPFVQLNHQGYSPSQQNYPHRGGRQSLDPNPFHSQSSYRGRGSFNNNRGKRDQFNGDKMRHRTGKIRNDGSSVTGPAPDSSQKPAEDGGKLVDGKKKKKKKRKTNTLGLTPAADEYQDSEEEDDADEEARLAQDATNPDVPRMPSDLAAWLKERKERFPTKARREAKEAELAKRRQQAAEQSARDKAKAKKDRDDRDAADKASKEKQPSTGESKLERQQRKAEKLRKQLEKAERKVQDAMKAGSKRKRDTLDYGDEEGEETNGIKVEGDIVDQVIAKATAATNDDSDSSSEDSSEYETDSDSDDSPETTTSRRTAPVHVLPPKKAILQRQCKYFSTGGTCGKKGKCRFVHDQSVRDAALREKELNGGRMTLSQRLVQNDKEKDDLVILKSIKYLHQRGVLNDPHAAGDFYGGDTEGQPQMHDEGHGSMEYEMEHQSEFRDEYMDSEV